MCSALSRRLRAGTLIVAISAPLVDGCGGDGGTDVVLPSLTITTSTSGVELDPDGYTVQVDHLAPRSIGLEATVTFDRLAEGPHTVTLSGLEPNCVAQGENPRTVSVSATATPTVAFAVFCSPTNGTLEVVTATTGPEPDADGFTVIIDGTNRGSIAPTTTVSYAGLTPGMHTVGLEGVAPNCQAVGDHPLGVAVEPGETARVSFAITCAATTGALGVTISGLPGGTPAAVTVTGPGSFSRALTTGETLSGIAPGRYTVSAANVVSGGTTYTPSIGRPAVDVVAGDTAAVTVSYTAVADITLNLRIDGLYVTQSTQTYGSSVPLVAGRDAYLRVFVVANENNRARPRVRVRVTRSGASAQTFNIEAPGPSTPTQVQEGSLSSSWNLRLPGSVIQSGLSIVAEVDPNTAIDESNESDNRFPTTGSKELTVRNVPPARIRFVSVQQGSSAPGNVSAGNTDQLMALARRMHPLNAVDADVHSSVFTASAPLEANGVGWNQVLSDLDALRVSDGSDRTYFGIARLTYGRQAGLVGLAFQGLPTALGWDDAGDAPRVVAHELGHTWDRLHTVCGNPPPGSIDLLYPYPAGQIGVNGLDVSTLEAKPASSPDIMGYCFQEPWISDYNYQAVMAFRATGRGTARVSGAPQASLLVWGRIVEGRPVLEPAFEIVTRPSLPRRPGPYSVTATATDGSRLFSLSFEAASAADDPRGNGHFAFAVPLERIRAARLAELRLSGPGGTVRNAGRTASLQMGAAVAPQARREGHSVVIQWNASTHPTIMVRDPGTGQVLSFARGGHARLVTDRNELELVLSDGVKSQRLRLAISRS